MHGCRDAFECWGSAPLCLLLRTVQCYSSVELCTYSCTAVFCLRGTAGPLAGGAASGASSQWTPGAHRAPHGPLPALPYPLPTEYDKALQSKYAVVTDLRARIKGSVLEEGRRQQLQGVIQAYFREWLHSSGAIRQVQARRL